MSEEKSSVPTDEELKQWVASVNLFVKECIVPISCQEDFNIYKDQFRKLITGLMDEAGPGDIRKGKQGQLVYKFMETLQKDFPAKANHEFINRMKPIIGSPN